MSVGAEDLAAIFVLDSLKGFGPVRFRRLWEAGVRAREVIERPEMLPVKGKQDEAVREQLLKLDRPELHTEPNIHNVPPAVWN